LTDSNQNPGRKWRHLENDGDGDQYFGAYRFTPFTTDTEFFRDPNIYEADEVSRTTQDEPGGPDTDVDPRPRGERRTDEEIRDEIQGLLVQHSQVDASDIQVSVQDGVVTLSGNVESWLEKQIAESVVRNVLGVLEVNNQLNANRQTA
jgi:hypothetical protein